MIKICVKRRMHTPQADVWLDVDLAIAAGAFITIFGDSGAGKTTLLKILAGLMDPQEGSIEVDGELWLDTRQKINRPVGHRRIGFVSQENSLFAHMTVYQNLEYACRDKNERQSIEGWLVTMGLKGLEHQRSDKISSGQKQRVALARALIGRPQILLLDEPLSRLDQSARVQLQDEIIKVYQQIKMTTILVSHDLVEVCKLSSKILVMHQGKITQSGSPQEIVAHQDGRCPLCQNDPADGKSAQISVRF